MHQDGRGNVTLSFPFGLLDHADELTDNVIAQSIFRTMQFNGLETWVI